MGHEAIFEANVISIQQRSKVNPCDYALSEFDFGVALYNTRASIC